MTRREAVYALLTLAGLFVAFAFWVGPEARRIGVRAGWVYPLPGLFIAFAFAYPLFLLRRERHLRMQRN